MIFDDESQRDRERSEAIEAWVAAFGREMAQTGDLAAAVATMSAHGCFDLRAVVERWVMSNPTGDVVVAYARPVLQEPVDDLTVAYMDPVQRNATAGASSACELPVVHEPRGHATVLPVDEPVPDFAPSDAAPREEAAASVEESGVEERDADADAVEQRAVTESSPDIAHFHSLLQGGIDREQIYEAFPAFRFVIDEAFVQYQADAPILSEVPSAPSREDLDDEIRRTRQELMDSKKPRRRWRSRG
jgi:hypothetical protein